MLVSEIEGRQEFLAEFGDSLHVSIFFSSSSCLHLCFSWKNDMIAWFLTHDAKAEMPVDELVNHILLVNYLAVHPLSIVSLLDLKSWIDLQLVSR
jgi:hypothetical protein